MRPRTFYLRPSSAAAWFHCAGYAALNASIDAAEERNNEVRDDGTACHWLAEHVWYESRDVAVGQLAPNGRELTQEMFLAVDDYHAILLSWPSQPQLERTLPVSSVFPGVQDGTPDAWVVHGDTIYIADLKYGFRAVEVWRNLQLIVYVWTLLALHPHVKHVHMTIFQPRCAHKDGPTRTWVTTRYELRPLAEALQAAARRAMEPSPVCAVNYGCGDCAASGACRTLQAAGGLGAEVGYDATPHIMTDAEVGYELTQLEAAAKHIENRITGLTAQAESLVRAGHRVPGYGLTRSVTRWRWREGMGERVAYLGSQLGVDVHAPITLKSVAKLRDSFPGLDIQTMYAERPTGELRLKATDPNEALRVFSQRKK